MFTLLRRTLKGLYRTRRSSTRRARTVLSLEALEDRLCPSIDVWTGAGANANWSTAANWQSGVVPQAGDTLSFSAGAASTTSVNNLAAGTTFNSIQFYGNDFVVEGNAVKLTNGINNNGSSRDTVDLPITLAAAKTITVATGTSLILGGSLNNGGFLLTVDSSGTTVFNGTSIAGAGGLTLEADGNYGSGKLILQNSQHDTYSGVTTIDSGNLYLDAAQGDSIVGSLLVGIGPGPVQNDVVRLCLSNQIADTSNVTVNAAGLLDLDGFTNTIDSLTMEGGFVDTGTGTLTLDGNVTTLATSTTANIEGNLVLGTGAGPRTFTVGSGSAGTDLDIKATISGATGVKLVKAGNGTLRLDADNSYTGQTLVSAGTLIAGNTDALGAAGVSVSKGATLEYDTTDSSTLAVGGSLTNAGVVDIQGAGAVGTLAIHGTFTQTTTGTLDLALASTSAFDQVTVSGAAALAGPSTSAARAGSCRRKATSSRS